MNNPPAINPLFTSLNDTEKEYINHSIDFLYSQHHTETVNEETQKVIDDALSGEEIIGSYGTMETGVKFKDACHIAAAILTGADYLISTDMRLLKYKTDEIKLINPVDFFFDEEEDDYRDETN